MTQKKEKKQKREEAFRAAGTGLWYLFLAPFVGALGVVAGLFGLRAVPMPNMALHQALTWFCVSVVIAALGASTLMEVAGAYVARNAHPRFRLALYLTVAHLAVSIVAVWQNGTVLGTVVQVLSRAVGFAQMYYLCTAAGDLLREKGDKVWADRAAWLWKLQGFYALLNVAIILGWLIAVPSPMDTVTKLVISIPSWLVTVAVSIMQLVVFYHSSKSLRN